MFLSPCIFVKICVKKYVYFRDHPGYGLGQWKKALYTTIPLFGSAYTPNDTCIYVICAAANMETDVQLLLSVQKMSLKQ